MSSFLRLLNIFKCTSDNIFLWKQAIYTLIRLLLGSSLIWVHIVCNIGYLWIYTIEREEDNIRDWRVIGLLYLLILLQFNLHNPLLSDWMQYFDCVFRVAAKYNPTVNEVTTCIMNIPHDLLVFTSWQNWHCFKLSPRWEWILDLYLLVLAFILHRLTDSTTALPAKGDSDVLFC